jgi:hypothetical protein
MRKTVSRVTEWRIKVVEWLRDDGMPGENAVASTNEEKFLNKS